MSEGDGVCHVDLGCKSSLLYSLGEYSLSTHGNGMTMTKGDTRSQLESGRPSMTECDNSIKTELVQIGGFKLFIISAFPFSQLDALTLRPAAQLTPLTHLEHRFNTAMANLFTRRTDGLATFLVPEASLDELRTMLNEKIPNGLVTDRSDLD